MPAVIMAAVCATAMNLRAVRRGVKSSSWPHQGPSAITAKGDMKPTRATVWKPPANQCMQVMHDVELSTNMMLALEMPGCQDSVTFDPGQYQG